MKKYALLSGLLTLCIVPLFAQWKIIQNWGALPVNDLEVRGDVLYAGVFRDFYRSKNGGLNWEKINTIGPYEDVFEVETTDNGVIYVGTLGADYWLKRSRNDGQSWETLPSPDGGFIVNFLNFGLVCADKYLFVTNGAKVYRIAETGTNWEEMPPTVSPGGFRSLNQYDGRIWVGTQDGYGWRSDDAGQNWTQFNMGTPYIAAHGDTLVKYDDYTLQTYAVSRSFNAGKDWERIELQVIPRSITASGGVFWMLSTQKEIFQSTDGKNWKALGFRFDPNYWSGVTAYKGFWLLPSVDGILRSADGGNHWWGTNTGIGGNPGPLQVIRNTLFAGKSHFTENAGENWKTMFNPGNYEHYYNFDNRVYIYNNDAVWRNTDGDFTKWEKVIPAGNFGIAYPRGFVRAGKYLFGSSFALDKGKVFRSSDEGFNWEVVSDLGGEIKLLGSIGDSVVFGSRTPPGSIQTALVISKDLGLNWELWDIMQVLGEGNRNFFTLGKKIYTTNGASLLMSEDNGKTWNHYGDNIFTPEQKANYYFYDFAVNDQLMFLASRHKDDFDRALWMSADTGKTWTNLLADPNDDDPLPTNIVLTTNQLYFYAGFTGQIWKRSITDILEGLQVGNVFWDDDYDGVLSVFDRPAKYCGLKVSNSTVAAITNEKGDFLLDKTSSGDTIRPVSPYLYTISKPAFGFSVAGNPPLSFALQRIPDINDLRVEAVAASDFLGGRDTKVHFFVTNDGTNPVSAELEVYFNENLSLVETTPDSLSFQGRRLSWRIDLLNPTEQQHFVATFKSAVAGFILDATVVSTVKIINEKTPLNNTDTLNANIFNSFDPNDKRVDRQTLTIAEAAKMPELTYTIRFQNTGSFPAIDIRLLDTLSPLLDPATIKLLGTSHSCRMQLTQSHMLEFLFKDIYLPDSIRDEPNSHGFVHFSIRPRQVLKLGESVPNTAHIFFDFNAPVTTNTVRTTVVPPLNIPQVYTAEVLQIYPNPSAGKTFVRLPEDRQGEPFLYLFTQEGRLLKKYPTDGQTALLNLEGQRPGYYWLRWRLTDGRWCMGQLMLQDD